MIVKEIRNLKRWYNVDISLARYNRKNTPITKQQLSILLAIYFNSPKPVTKTVDIKALLFEYKKMIRADILSRQLKYLAEEEFINKVAIGKSNFYRLSVKGSLELKEIETLVRTCR